MKVIWTGPLSQAEEQIDKLVEEIDGMQDVIIEYGADESYAIMRYGDYIVVIPELRISLYEGMCFRKDEDSETYEPDFNLTLIYEENNSEPENYLYWEQSGFVGTCANFMSTKYSIGEIAAMQCQLISNK